MHAILLPGHENNINAETLFRSVKFCRPQEQVVVWAMTVVFKPLGMKKIQRLTDIMVADGLLPGKSRDYHLTSSQFDFLVQKTYLIKSSKGLQINPLLCNIMLRGIDEMPTLQDLTAKQKLRAVISLAEEVSPIRDGFHYQDRVLNHHIWMRNCFFLQEFDKLEAALEFNKNPQVINHHANQTLVEVVFLPFDLERFLALPKSLQYQSFATLIRETQKRGMSCNYPVGLLRKVHDTWDDSFTPDMTRFNLDCHHLLMEQFLYNLDHDPFRIDQLSDKQSSFSLQIQAMYSFVEGNIANSIALFEQAKKAKNKIARRKNQYLNGLPGLFYTLALTVQGNNEDADYFRIAKLNLKYARDDSRRNGDDLGGLNRELDELLKAIGNGTEYREIQGYGQQAEDIDFFAHQLHQLIYLLGHAWCNQSKDKKLAKVADELDSKFAQLGMPLFGLYAQHIKLFNENKDVPKDYASVNICGLIKPKRSWDIALDKLIALTQIPEDVQPVKQEEKQARLIWLFEAGSYFCLHPREQKLGKTGWTKGRPVALKRLKKETSQFSYLAPSDIKLCNAISTYETGGYYSKTEYELEGLVALKAAIGADNLYLSDDLTQPVELTEKAPELLVSQLGTDLCLSIPGFNDEWKRRINNQTYALQRLSTYQFQATFFQQEHLKVGEIIGEAGLVIPASAKPKVLTGISAVAPLMNIQSDMAELDTGLETTDCDPNLFINIQPFEQGLSFTCVVMPFGEDGPGFKPGVGNSNISTEIKGKRLATKRDLQAEETLLDKLDASCPAFLAMSDNVLLEAELHGALEVLEQVQNVAQTGDIDIVLRWPKGKKLKLSHNLKAEHLQLAVGKNKEWFGITGDLRVNDEQVLELRKLLELMQNTGQRFVQLDDEQILVLSQDLRNRLEKINQVTDNGKFHALASLQIEEATQGMRMKTLHAWEKQTKLMREATEIEPQIPSTFQGELRDYQQAGFDWASRLAHWGAGACLADDMGLGKTLQALSMLLSRASGGPSLVIAPTSVCFNWQQEAVKFAPTLNIKLFSDASTIEERKQLLTELQPFDCVILSYGLLQRESDILKEVRWHSIVADEAQALKNPLAKRTKAAYALKGDFKMITTGTPVENDLTELWSLFRFVNPGLLGNLKEFGKRFAFPIENVKEDKLAAHQASQSLKTLIQPFILRRMKNQVLTELPSRTDITVPVAMSEEEMSFYEALRLNTVDNISKVDPQANVGEQRIIMLAELMKLRQACCNPKLITPEIQLPSAKLAALDELLEELKANNHKALIFSQFVGHLQLIKEHIETKGLSYQYLDGSTPQKQRQQRVNAFQAGEGDVFLISLKAGGSGLNLTAADYVIHMDPWWNPAVEEQASDRAHRMGQRRPVTIYRLVTQNTIEEKIVELHQHKRDLADKVLSGNEVASKLSVDDVLVLLKSTM